MNKAELVRQTEAKRSFLCVGLDSDPSRLPDSVRGESDPVLAFNREIIDATQDYCVAYKPNLAFYEAQGPKGWETLRQTVEFIPKECLVIADAKRGDIGNTAAQYAKAIFDDLGCDAVTLSPYMGSDSVAPFLEHAGKWVVLLALTSNAGGADFQRLRLESGERLFERVIHQAQRWADPDRLMFVAGATQADLLADVRAAAPENFLLVPGVGAQGGRLSDLAPLLTAECGLLVNASRAILYASQGDDFAEAAAEKARAYQAEMALMLSGRPSPSA